MAFVPLRPPSLVELMGPDIESSIRRLTTKKFNTDPICGTKFSRIISVASSAYKRHGYIIEKALVEHLRMQPELEVWTDTKFQVPQNADIIASGALKDFSLIVGNEVNYCEGRRTLQVDLLVYHKEERTLRAYEIKRGAGHHDNQKKEKLALNALCLQLLLRSYGKSKNLEPQSVGSHIIFYYDSLSVPPPIGIKGSELDEHFGLPVRDAIETVNKQFGESFRACLLEMLSS